MPTENTRRERKANADFAVKIDFEPGSPDPSRVFRSMTQLIETFQRFDQELVHTIDVNIHPVMLLEDVETGSIKGWLSAWLEATDDTGLEELNWKRIVGGYLVKAKWLLVDFLNRETKLIGKQDLDELRGKIQAAAVETGVKRIPAYTSPSKALLVRSITDINVSLGPLQKGDKASFETSSGDVVPFNLTLDIAPESLQELLVEESLAHDEEMILKVKKPDFLGDSQWEFVHDTVFSARVIDAGWLTLFRKGDIVLQPGSALRATVHVEVGYGYDREIVSRKYQVTRVLDVIQPQANEQHSLITEN